MSQATYEDAALIMKLFELRREEKLRKARAWMQKEFSANSYKELTEKYPQGSEENAYIRMVLGYWDMAASFLVHGIVHEELFFESNVEMLGFWVKIKPVVEELRNVTKNPMVAGNLEKAAARCITWLSRNAPGAYEALQARLVKP